jgi:hypothetical protein
LLTDPFVFLGPAMRSAGHASDTVVAPHASMPLAQTLSVASQCKRPALISKADGSKRGAMLGELTSELMGSLHVGAFRQPSAKPHLAVGITNSLPLLMLSGQRCMMDFCLV